MKAWSLNHRTTREVHLYLFSNARDADAHSGESNACLWDGCEDSSFLRFPAPSGVTGLMCFPPVLTALRFLGGSLPLLI